eukprot:TRINITY_DN30292_c0_g1_i1.p1 TRINITY_DN30292_c0_g1~~TRINITY_DN30292_c0_g1_i1.p1  ORF type:complete len:1377 (-),score=390.87 TRINITY_DN30292_c0_g1_i1:83-4087(-)
MSGWFEKMQQAAQKAAQDAAKISSELQVAAAKHASELQQSASALAQSAVSEVSTVEEASDDGGSSMSVASLIREYVFDEGGIGFMVQGTRVVAIEPGGQADRQGVKIGDILLSIDGERLPKPPTDVPLAEAEAKMRKLIARKVKERPRPVTLTFETPSLVTVAVAEGATEDGDASAPTAPVAPAAAEDSTGAFPSQATERAPSESAADAEPEQLTTGLGDGGGHVLEEIDLAADGDGAAAADVEANASALSTVLVDASADSEMAQVASAAACGWDMDFEEPPVAAALPPAPLADDPSLLAASSSLVAEETAATSTDPPTNQNADTNIPSSDPSSAVLASAEPPPADPLEDTQAGGWDMDFEDVDASAPTAPVALATAEEPTEALPSEAAENERPEIAVDAEPEQVTAGLGDGWGHDLEVSLPLSPLADTVDPTVDRCVTVGEDLAAALAGQQSDVIGDVDPLSAALPSTDPLLVTLSSADPPSEIPPEEGQAGGWDMDCEVSPPSSPLADAEDPTMDRGARVAKNAATTSASLPSDEIPCGNPLLVAPQSTDPLSAIPSSLDPPSEVPPEEAAEVVAASAAALEVMRAERDEALTTCQRLTSEAAGEVARLRAQNNEVDEKLRDSESLCAQRESSLFASQATLAQLRTEIEELDDAYGREKELREVFSTRVESLSSSLEQKTELVEQKTEQVAKASELGRSLVLQRETHKKEIFAARAEAKSTGEELERERAALEELHVQSSTRDARLREEHRLELERHFSEQEALVLNFRGDGERRLEEHHAEHSRRLIEEESALKQLREASERQLEEAVLEGQAAREEAGRERAALEERLSEATTQIAERGGGLTKTRDELRLATERGQRSRNELEQCQAELEEARRTGEERNGRLGAVHSMLGNRVEVLQNQLAEAKSEQEPLLLRIDKLTAELDAGVADREALRATIAQREEEKCQAAKAADAREATLKEEVAIALAEVAAVERKLHESVRQAAMAEEQREADAARAAERCREAEATAQRRGAEDESTAAAAAEAQAKMAAQNAEVLAEAERCRVEAEAARSDAEKHKQLMRLLQQRLAEQERDAQKKQQELLAEITKAREELDASRQEASEAKRQLVIQAMSIASMDGVTNVADKTEVPPIVVGAEGAANGCVGIMADGSFGSPSPTDEEGEVGATAVGARGIAASAPERAGHEEVPVLYERIALLEKRCVGLQRKLNARPIVFQEGKTSDPETGGGGSASMADLVAVGTRGDVRGVTKVLKRRLEMALRGFTQRLLKRDAWLLLFYAHLFVLYAIAGSCFAATSPTTGLASDHLEIHMREGLNDVVTPPVTGGLRGGR